MSIEYKNNDFILQIDDEFLSRDLSIVNKYDAFLEALTTADFEHVREAIKKAIHFFVTDKFVNTEQAAVYTFNKSEKLQSRYSDLSEYLKHIRIKDKKSYSIDLATGTGKSWVIYEIGRAHV